MEALAILIGEFVGMLAMVAILGLQLVMSLLSFLFHLAWWMLDRRPADRRPQWTRKLSEHQVRSIRRITRIATGALLALLMVSGIGLAVINYAFLDEAIRFIARRVEARTGVALSYKTMEGDLFRGRLVFTGVRVRNEASATAQFDLQVAKAATTFSFWDLLRGRKHLQTVNIEGIGGDFVRLAQASRDPAILEEPGRVKIRVKVDLSAKAFRVEQLHIRDGIITVDDRTKSAPVSYLVTITAIHAQPLRSGLLWFDLLYRSNMDLTVDAARIVVENRDLNNERSTLWSITDIAAPVLASLVGGPFTLFTGGAIDVRAEDTWTLKREAEITMDWRLTLRDVRAAAPQSIPALLRAPAEVFVDHVNAREEPWELGFTLTLREGQFTGAATLDAQQIWAGTLEAFLKESLRLDDARISTLKERARSGLSRFEEFIKGRDERRAQPQPGAETPPP